MSTPTPHLVQYLGVQGLGTGWRWGECPGSPTPRPRQHLVCLRLTVVSFASPLGPVTLGIFPCVYLLCAFFLW